MVSFTLCVHLSLTNPTAVAQQPSQNATVGEPISDASGDAASGDAASGDNSEQLRAHVSALINQLGDDNYHRRETAKWELERIGLVAFEQLRQAAQSHPQAHVARAARYLIDSQNVVWWLETDSLEVRQLLTTYNDSSQEDRDTVLQQLSERATSDALLALCRLARYESNELRSKSAALYLMQAISQQLSKVSKEQPTPPARLLPASILLTLGNSNRTAAKWLSQFMKDLGDLTTFQLPVDIDDDAQRQRLSEENLVAWRGLIAQEHAEVAATTADDGTAGNFDLDHFRSTEVTLRFYRWLGSWITANWSRGLALEVVRPSLQLIGSEAHVLQTAAQWALEADLPELVIESAASFPKQFSSEPELGYFLAEGQLRMGNEQAAQRAANIASDSVLELLHKLQNFPTLNLEEIQANRHYQLARSLAERGMNQWAEQEFVKALEFESRQEPEIRSELAQFYWFGDKYEQAAQVLKPLADETLDSHDLELPSAPGVYTNPGAILANFYFYSGLAAIDRGDKIAASELLRKSMQVDSVFPNPDAVIAMQQIAGEEPFDSYFREHFDQMSKSFRIRVLQAEEQLSRSVDRMSRAMAGPTLAAECNQLAWLLSKCEVSPNEAIGLSLRSLELMPDEPAYLDTLARCYFSAGQVEKAIRVQKLAVKLAPHERQMAAQLQEFETALPAEKSE